LVCRGVLRPSGHADARYGWRWANGACAHAGDAERAFLLRCCWSARSIFRGPVCRARNISCSGFSALGSGLVLRAFLRSVQDQKALPPGLARQEPGPTKPMSRLVPDSRYAGCPGMDNDLFQTPGLEEILSKRPMHAWIGRARFGRPGRWMGRWLG